MTSADPNSYQAPFRSGANVEAYQLEPLRRALQAPRTNLLLADDVGLGKTIEAGLVIQELLLRHRARTVVIVCPPSLSLKWQDEMREKFGLDFVIVDSALMAQVRRSHGLAANPFRLFPRVIVSMAWLPSVRAQRLLRDVYAEVARPGSGRRFAFDALVVDEAHHVAPASPSALGGGRGYAVDSHRTIATRELATRCEHRLFLTATPHNGHTESFTALLEMVDNRRFSRGATLDEHALREVAVRRLKSQIADKSFQPRQIKTVAFEPTREEQEAFEHLSTLLADSARANGRERSGDIVALLLKKRFLSSPWAFARTLEHYQQAATTGTAGRPGRRLLHRGPRQRPERRGGGPDSSTLSSSRCARARAPTRSSRRRPRSWTGCFAGRRASSIDRTRGSPRCSRLLDSVCRPDGRTWTNERVVVFTEYVDTLDWIVGVLKQHGYGPVLADHHRCARRRTIGRWCGSASPSTRPRTRCGCSSPRTPQARASTCRPTVTAWSATTCRSTRRGSSSGSGGSTGTASGSPRRSTTSRRLRLEPVCR